MLKERSGFALTIKTKTNKTLRSTKVFQSNSWRTAVRLVDQIEDDYGTGRLWKATNFEIPIASGNHSQPAGNFGSAVRFEGRSGGLLTRGEMILLSLQPQDHPHRFLPKSLDYVIARPPTLDAVAQGLQDSLTQVNYQAAGENGLSKPFCGNSATAFAVSWPRDARGDAIDAARVSQIKIELTMQSLDGLKILTTDQNWPAPYHAVVEETDRFGSTRQWSPSLGTLTYQSWDFANADQVRIEIPAETIGDGQWW